MIDTILQGDALATLRTLSDASVQMCVTSPPYFGLRDYGVPEQIGLEETPEQYIDNLVQVFREVRRVLRNDGTLWMNMGDSYAGANYRGSGIENASAKQRSNAGTLNFMATKQHIPDGYKPKDLMMIPARIALALQADGWYLRSDIIWHKVNCMPESVTDRPTSAHEHIFLLAKSERYYYDADAIREPHADVPHTRGVIKGRGRDDMRKGKGSAWATFADGEVKPTFHNPLGRNKRNVWTVASQPYPESHFATFPPKLIEPCILAGSSPRACEQCSAPWERVTVPTGHINKREPAHAPHSTPTKVDSTGWAHTRMPTDQWKPTCACPGNTGAAKCIVLDPFMGAGTTALVALRHGRQYVGIELNPDYVALAEKRIRYAPQELWSLAEAEAVS